MMESPRSNLGSSGVKYNDDYSWMSTDHGPPDVTLEVDGQRIPCHRKVLGQSSSYFQAMFSCEMKEKHAEVIPLKEVSFDALRRLVKYAYLHLLVLEPDTVIDITLVASMLQFTKAMQQCQRYLLEHLSVSNCLDYMHLADDCGIVDLFNKAKRHVLWEYGKVTRQMSFLSLGQDELCEFLQENMLHVDSELVLFNAVISWINHSKDERLKSIPHLLKFIRYGVMSAKELAAIQKCDLLQQCPYSLAVVRKLLDAENDGMQMSSIPKVMFRPRCVPSTLCFFGQLAGVKDAKDAGGQDVDADDSYPRASQSLSGSPQLFCLKQGEDSQETSIHVLSKCPSLPQLPQGYSATVVGPDLYICGGEHQLGRNSWSLNVACYFGLVGAWEIVSQLPQPRRHHSAVAWKHYLYLIGGVGRHRVILDNVERFSTDTGDWEKMPSLLEPVYSAAACVCGDRLYVIKHHMEYLQQDALQWTQLEAPLPYTKGISRCYAYKSSLYIVTEYAERQLSVYNIENGSVSIIEKDEPLFETVLTVIDSDVYVCLTEDEQLHIVRFSTVNNTQDTLLKLPESALRISKAFPMNLFPKFR